MSSEGKYTVFSIAISQLKFYRLREGEDDKADLLRLGESVKKQQDYPIILGLEPENEVYDGNRRLAAAMLVGITHLDAIRLPYKPTPDQIHEIFLRTTVHRKSATDWEKFRSVKLIAEAHSDWTRKRLSQHLDLDQSEVTRLLTEGCPEVEEAFRAGAIGVSVRYELAKLTNDEQRAKLKEGSLTRDKLVEERKRRSAPQGEKAARIKIELGTYTVTISGAGGLSLDQAVEAVSEAGKELRRGRDQGLTAKTLSKMVAERAKAGAS